MRILKQLLTIVIQWMIFEMNLKIINELHTSLQPTIKLMEDIIKRLELKEGPEINELWNYILNRKDSLT